MVDTLWRGNRKLMHDLKLFVGMMVILSPDEPPLEMRLRMGSCCANVRFAARTDVPGRSGF